MRCCGLIIILLAHKITSLTLNHETGAYEDLVLAISGNVLSENATLDDKQQIIDQTKNLVQEISDGLLEISDGSLSVGKAIILVPREWEIPQITDKQLGYEDADVRVDVKSEIHGDLPYTHQPHPCGVQGRYIHVTPDFVAGATNVLQRTGAKPRVMAHEWAQYRWGIREEYGYPGDVRYPYFHQDVNGYWVATGSNVTEINGTLSTPSSEECTFSKSGEPSTDCRFYPYLNESASIMHFHHLETEAFLSTNESFNRLSPNKQCNVCYLKSAWEIIAQHDDFQSAITNPAPSDPIIEVFQPDLASASVLYIVLDITAPSSSEGNDIDKTVKIFNTYKEELTAFFNRFSDGARIALYTYSGLDTTFIMETLVDVGTLGENREALITAVNDIRPRDSSVRRDSLEPLLRIAEIAQTQNNGERSTLFFTQNGRGGPPEEDAIPELLAANVGVVGIGFDQSANAPNLITICSSTGGRSFLLLEPYSIGFYEAIDFAGLGDQPSTRLYQVSLGSTLVTPGESHTLKIYMEEALGNNANFMFGPLLESVIPTLTDPSGQEVNITSDICEQVVALSQYLCSFPDAQAGEWTLQLTCTDDCKDTGESAQWSVTSYIRSDPENQWPTMTAWISGEGGVVDLNIEDLLIYAELRQLYRPLINATVKAVIEDQNSVHQASFILRDDGREPDVISGDGVYVAKAVPISSEPMFLSIQVNFESEYNMFIYSNIIGNGWGILPIDQDLFCCGSGHDDNFLVENYRMERSLNLSVIVRALNYNDEYHIEPQTIEDLSVSQVEYSSSDVIVKVSWTAPHARVNFTQNDTVEAYDLFFSLNSEVILDKLEEATLVTRDMITAESDMEPLWPDESQQIDVMITIPNNYKGPIFFRIRSNNSYGLLSPMSRVAFTLLDPSKESDGGSSGDGGNVTDEAWFISLMALIGLAIIGSVLIFTWIAYSRYQRRNEVGQALGNNEDSTNL